MLYLHIPNFFPSLFIFKVAGPIGIFANEAIKTRLWVLRLSSGCDNAVALRFEGVMMLSARVGCGVASLMYCHGIVAYIALNVLVERVQRQKFMAEHRSTQSKFSPSNL